MAAEAGRLLTRVWAPRAARRGGPTWTLTKADRPQEEDGAQLSSVEDPVISKQAKSIGLGPTGRYREHFGKKGKEKKRLCLLVSFLIRSQVLYQAAQERTLSLSCCATRVSV